jgi:hypothetical protein
VKALPFLLLAAAASAAAQTPEAVPPFDGIEISGSADVRFVQGSPVQVVVEGDADARKRIEFDVAPGRTLRIRSSGDWRFWSAQRAQLTVTAPQLARLVISGSGSLHAPQPLAVPRLSLQISGAGHARLDHLDAESLQFQASGAGEGTFAGQVRDLSIGISGRGDVRAENLAARVARVSISGVGDVRLWVNDALSVNVAGIGKVEYWGTPPVVHRSASGAARVTPLGPKAPGP